MFKFEQEHAEKPDYIIGQKWSLLKKAWKNYQKAKDDADAENMIKFAKRVRSIQAKFGIKQTEFSELKEAF